jgi:hypothetical protein
MLPYPTRLRLHLQESRTRGVSFERAWEAAVRLTVSRDINDVRPCTSTCRSDTGNHVNCGFLKRHFRNGYLRIGSVSAFTPEICDDDWTEDARRVRSKRAAA